MTLTIGQRLSSLGLLLFFALTFWLPKSYGAAFFFLCLMGIAACVVKPQQRPLLSYTERCWIWALLAFFVCEVLLKLSHHAPLNQYDNLSRYLCAILLVFTFSRWKIRDDIYRYALWIGALATFAAAAYPKFILHLPPGDYGHIMHILFSNIAMITGMGCLFATHLTPNHKSSIFISLLAAVLAISAAFLGGGRGSWLILPIGYLCFLCTITREKRLRFTLISLAVLLVIALTLYLIPQTDISTRIHSLFNDFHQYAQGKANTSQGMRLEMWKCGLEKMYPQHPWLGFGSEGLTNTLHQLAQNQQCFKDLNQFNHLHNDYIDQLVRYGVLGAIVFMAFHLYPLITYYHALKQPLNAQQRTYAQTGIMVSLAFLLGGLSNANFTHSIITFYFLMWQTLLMSKINRLPYPLSHEV